MVDGSHSRKNILNGDWVLVSPHRTERPWQGQLEQPDYAASPRYDADCYLCPGNLRAKGAANPDYTGTYVFDNDFSALSGDGGSATSSATGALFQAVPTTGFCKVVCFSEDHSLRLATMQSGQISAALSALFEEFRTLDERDSTMYVQVFENRGKMMGCSNSHPHAQIWATSTVPNEPARELVQQGEYWSSNGTTLLGDYRDAEVAADERIVCGNDHFVVLVPYWATWPFETLILPRRDFAGPGDMQQAEVDALAEVLRQTLAAYDRLFNTSVPYSMGYHARPSDGREHPEWVFHAHIYPPLLRSATVRKHMVGFEMLGMPQRDLTPEVAAERLRESL